MARQRITAPRPVVNPFSAARNRASDRPVRWRLGGRGSGVQAALFLRRLLPPPATGARVLAGAHRARARGAADRWETTVVQGVVGDVVALDMVPDLFLGPVGERIDFHYLELRVALD